MLGRGLVLHHFHHLSIQIVDVVSFGPSKERGGKGGKWLRLTLNADVHTYVIFGQAGVVVHLIAV